MSSSRPIKIVDRKLGKEKVWGWAHLSDNKIELDSRLKGYRHLLYLIHETLHIINPDWSETRIKIESSRIARTLWKAKYRRVDI